MPVWETAAGSLAPASTQFLSDSQRRQFSVTYGPPTPAENVEETEDICIAQLRKHVDHLRPGVYGIRFSEPDGPVTISTPARDDVKGVIFTLYEIITPGRAFPGDVKLDSDIEAFRAVLDAWVKKRRRMMEYQPAESWIRWPFMREPPPARVPRFVPDGEITKIETENSTIRVRQHLVRMGEPFWKWERPASYQTAEAPGNGYTCHCQDDSEEGLAKKREEPSRKQEGLLRKQRGQAKE
ncbi:uncharacterized protein B0T15DRAFT_510488 [Chaetomium strumarium]|uniref:Uncharacterized protein n=1 Tax=Chaetomium strumarium TaxID=1170767 RepID=A0AAJ0M301_9PEZI|nr:hypothetical protein B0T15DRAFT_510488 [Chaetomium strumarium]